MPTEKPTIIYTITDEAPALAKAQTGTGKTAAFSLPLLNKIDLNQRKPQAIVLAPTRELAIQVAAEMKNLGKNIKGQTLVAIAVASSVMLAGCTATATTSTDSSKSRFVPLEFGGET